MTDQPHGHLAQVLGNLAVEMQAEKSSSDTLQSITNAAPKLVPGTRWAGISLIEGRKIVAQVPTSRAVAELDQLQSDLNQGPCLTALREFRTVHIDDMRTDTRWPDFSREAQQRGMLSMLSFQLFVRSENLGALNLYSDEPGVFSEESFLIGGVLAQHAAIAMIGAAAETQFEAALATRDIIGQAKGILMQRENFTGLQAFNLLASVSQETNIKLVDVARWLINQHESELGHHSTERN
jgi:GAF domain-containing protein